MYRIGIDFDNTIACYDRAFADVAARMGLAAGEDASKAEVKGKLLQHPDGDLAWQRLQGQVYGKYMYLAEIFPGFIEFVHLCKLHGHSVVIVSHKTEFGHFDEEHIPLRDQALNWMRSNRFFDENELFLQESDVYFESTRDEKICRIKELGCTHFIDDLYEVFDDLGFPEHVSKFWFRPNTENSPDSSISIVMSWKEISNQILGPWSGDHICRVAGVRFPELGIKQAALRKGRGNSRIFELVGTGINYALKIYPDRQFDDRPRLQNEFAACQYLKERGYHVMQAVAKDEAVGWAVYEWINGSAVDPSDEQFFNQAVQFIRCLATDSQNVMTQFPEASEACLTGEEIVHQINCRLKSLRTVESSELQDFLDCEFATLFAYAVLQAKQATGSLFNTPLSQQFQILSPSDFGSHNALQPEHGQIQFIDFEYFGWDDPVKLVSDFYWHPGMNLQQDIKIKWIMKSCEIFASDPSFSNRLMAYLPLYGCKWCMILLNEFLKRKLAHRINADIQKEGNQTAICAVQLQKSKTLLKQISEVLYVHG